MAIILRREIGRGLAAARRSFSTSCEVEKSAKEGKPINLFSAINQALHISIETDPRAYVFGEDVSFGGVFRYMTGSADRSGRSRVVEVVMSSIAPCGGYVAGRKSLVEMATARLSAPGLRVDCGSTPGDVMRLLFQGLFLSPQMFGEAIKGGLLIAEVMASKGYKVQPLPRHPRHDTVQLSHNNLSIVPLIWSKW